MGTCGVLRPTCKPSARACQHLSQLSQRSDDEREDDEPEEDRAKPSKRGKMLRKPFSRRNDRSFSLRRLCISRSRSQGSGRERSGGTTGANPDPAPVGKFRRRRRGPCSTPDRSAAGQDDASAHGLPKRHAPAQGEARRSWPFELSPQPRESWRSVRAADVRTCGRAQGSSTSHSSARESCASCRTARAVRAACSHARRHAGWL